MPWRSSASFFGGATKPKAAVAPKAAVTIKPTIEAPRQAGPAHSQSSDGQEGVKTTNTKEFRRKNSAVQEKLQSPAPSKVRTLQGSCR
jgi:hypothetical protein